MSRIIAILNQKGGVGKTTTAVNLAAGLAQAGQRTLLIDLDPQGNATTGLGVAKAELTWSIYDVLLRECGWEQAVVRSYLPNLDLLPSTLDLAGAVVELATVTEREFRLRDGVRGAEETYPYIIIDTPPSLGLLPVNCMALATEVIVPMQCEFFALEGLSQLEHTLRLVKRGLNADLEVFGILLTMVDFRTRLCREVAHAVRKQYGTRVFRSAVPRAVSLSEAPSYGESILTYHPRGKGARAYADFVKEVLSR